MPLTKKDKAKKWFNNWKMWLTVLGLLIGTTEYISGFFSAVGTGIMNAKTLIEVADNYDAKVKEVEKAFAERDSLRRLDSLRTMMLWKAVMDTIREKERGAKRFARISTKIDIGEMEEVSYNGYTIWATNHQIDPVTKQVHTGYYIYKGEPYGAHYDDSFRNYYIVINGKEVYCNTIK